MKATINSYSFFEGHSLYLDCGHRYTLNKANDTGCLITNPLLINSADSYTFDDGNYLPVKFKISPVTL